MSENAKPLGRKGYGSIPHLPNSRLGPGDWSIGPGQAAILCEKIRNRHDRILVTEKLDGSCVTIARVADEILPITRAGYHALSSPFRQHHFFAAWVAARKSCFLAALSDGQRIAGEWLAQAHGTLYTIADEHDLFVAFDVLVQDAKVPRLPHDAARAVFAAADVRAAAVLSDGAAMSVPAALAALSETGMHGALDVPEGAVWRCETRGEFNFIAKFVRPDKQDGKYLEVVTNTSAVWNWSAYKQEVEAV